MKITFEGTKDEIINLMNLYKLGDNALPVVLESNTISNSEPPSTVRDNSWLDTFFEISCHIGWELSQEPMPKKIEEEYEDGGHWRMRDFAKELTDEFEAIHKNREWDGEFFDEIDKFCDEKFNQE